MEDEPYAAPRPAKARPPKRPKQRGRGKKLLKFISLILILSGLAAGGYLYYRHKHPAVTPVQSEQPVVTSTAPSPTPGGTVRLIAVGDSLAFDTLNNVAKQPDGSYDYTPMMANFKTLFAKADVRVCNETTPAGGSTDGLAVSGYPTFNAPIGWNSSFANLGCNVINLASEHTFDKGQTAVNKMLNAWDSQKDILAVSGANRNTDEQSKIRYFSVKGLKFAYLAYTTASNNKPADPFSVNIYSDAQADKELAEAHKSANLVIVSINWGTENDVNISADQDRIAQHLADNNADVVLGGGPRVLQPAKILNGKNNHQTLVWYSLGNFLNSELNLNNLIGGMAVMDFDITSQAIKDPKLLPVYMHYEWTPQQKASSNLNARTNFQLYPLDQAAAPLAKSLNNTTVAAQMSYVKGIITKFAPVKVITSADY
jgi:poly-gamma-glutamate synthesis protein (capsule biosynthesis protein)